MINTVKKFTPLHDKIFVKDLDSGMRKTFGGIFIPDDNLKAEGIRDRWAKVYSMGPKVDYLSVGSWVLIAHGRWSLSINMEGDDGEIIKIWRIDPENILLVTDTDPREALPV